ncbi:E3 ubiquitin-protein ligase TRIM39-like [Engraulis encrasicolus]|uniref:E3 ubiquitin-protein ligase TRIM39-like n=1 Tax=Engraulis encrasicolus TaxID=184585 RepID=UPI002FD4EFF1
MKGNADWECRSTERGNATEGTENDPNTGECVRSETKLQTTEMSTNTLTQEMAEKSTTTNAQIIRKAGRETILGDIVQLTLDEKTAPGFLKVETKAKRQLVTCKDPGKMAAQGTQHPHVLCKERFSSHQHYWTVRGESFLGKLPDLLSRQSWYVGVCTATAAESKVKLPLTPENGYWVLHYQKGTGLSTNSEPTFPTSGRNDHIYVLGVHLDCDNNTLSFYNSDEDTHICTFYNIPPLKTFIPLICPGVSDGDLMLSAVFREPEQKSDDVREDCESTERRDEHEDERKKRMTSDVEMEDQCESGNRLLLEEGLHSFSATQFLVNQVFAPRMFASCVEVILEDVFSPEAVKGIVVEVVFTRVIVVVW